MVVIIKQGRHGGHDKVGQEYCPRWFELHAAYVPDKDGSVEKPYPTGDQTFFPYERLPIPPLNPMKHYSGIRGFVRRILRL